METKKCADTTGAESWTAQANAKLQLYCGEDLEPSLRKGTLHGIPLSSRPLASTVANLAGNIGRAEV
jgi:hypothetical protein